MSLGTQTAKNLRVPRKRVRSVQHFSSFPVQRAWLRTGGLHIRLEYEIKIKLPLSHVLCFEFLLVSISD